MSIRVACHCGHVTRARAELAGKELGCPACGKKCPVPRAETDPSPPARSGETLCAQCRKALPAEADVCPECGQDTTGHAAPSCLIRPEREIALICLVLTLVPLLVAAGALSEAGISSAALWAALVAAIPASIVLSGTRTRFDVLREPTGPRFRQRFTVAWIPIRYREVDLAAVRTVQIAYDECYIKRHSWALALLLMLCGILPGLIYAYWLFSQGPQSEEGAATKLDAYAMHWLSLADAGGTILDTLELRREKQVQTMLRMLTSVVDIDVERS